MLYVVLGCVLASVFWWIVQRISQRARADLQKQIDRLSAAIRNLEPEVKIDPAASHQNQNLAPAHDESDERAHISAGCKSISVPTPDRARIETAVSARLGRKVIVQSIKEIGTADPAGTWATQGWIAVHSSHNQLARHD